MQKTVLKIIIYIASCLIVPFVITMFMTGVCEETGGVETAKTVILQNDRSTQIIDVTEFVTGAVAAYYKAEDSAEFLKAFAVVARTYGEYMKGDGAMVNSADLALTTFSTKEMKAAWGDNYDTYYQAVKKAVDETESQVMTCDGELIMPYFHLISAGMTRKASEKYLAAVDCSGDMDDEHYISIVEYSESDIAAMLKKTYKDITFDGGVAESFQIVDRDDSGYVTELMVGNLTMSGDSLARCLNLPSAGFSVSSTAGNVVFTVKGSGSGYGMSLNNARNQAVDGADYQEILNYYYKNIQITSE